MHTTPESNGGTLALTGRSSGTNGDLSTVWNTTRYRPPLANAGVVVCGDWPQLMPQWLRGASLHQPGPVPGVSAGAGAGRLMPALGMQHTARKEHTSRT